MMSLSDLTPQPGRRMVIALVMLACVGGFFGPWASAPAWGEPPAETEAVTKPAGSFVIPAWAFNRGNAKTFTTSWADAGPMVANGGTMPNVVEYDIEFPVPATYTLNIYYAAHGARPVELSLGETSLGSCCRTVTGSWNTSGAAWEASASVRIAQGKHTIRLKRNGPFPHLVSLRFDSSEPFPKEWKLVRPKARKLDSPPPISPYLGYSPNDVKPEALRRAIDDLVDTFGDEYPKGADYLKRLAALEEQLDQVKDEAGLGNQEAGDEAAKVGDALRALRDQALLGNPLIDFDKLLVVVRGEKSPSLGLPRNWQSNSSLPKTGFDDRIAVLSPLRGEGELSTLFQPEGGKFVGDVDLNFDARRMLFSMPGSHDRWQVFEVGVDGSGLRELTGEQPDVDSYDACYLPDDKIIFTSTACFIGVPCVFGSSHVANLYLMDGEGKNIRQLCFDQEHDWCPAVLNNGRVLYSRWEYVDTPHSNTRLLFHMNPDGTEQ
ncbi:MAG: hypothetical protein HQ582_34200, partial [Planctomycetes bacterium]|nr:hypothetical protein [Planctomycetota bacterium]